MRVFRIIMLSLLSIVDAYSIYATIGYIILGIQTPKLIGNTTTIFTGMYIMALTFFAVVILSTTIIVVIARKLKNTPKSK